MLMEKQGEGSTGTFWTIFATFPEIKSLSKTLRNWHIFPRTEALRVISTNMFLPGHLA